MADIPLPENLYQYQPCNELTMANIINSVIHLGSPSRFNDPFDCTFTFPPPTTEQLPLLRKSLLDNGSEPLPESDAELASLVASRHNATYQLIKSETIDKLGVCCLSEHHPESDGSFLMWSHYANKHYGFCLEFDTAKKPFSTAKYVDYVDAFPCVDIQRIQIEDRISEDDRDKCLGTKSTHWEYEKEWRLISQKAGYEEYNPSQLTAVYFGFRMSDVELNAISKVLCSYGKQTPLFRMRPLNDSYRLEADKLIYND